MDLKTIASTNDELFIDQFHEGFVRVRRSSDNTLGFYDRKGKFNSPPTTAAILGQFQEGMAGVCIPYSGVWGFIDLTMRWVFPPTQYTYMDDGFSEGFARARLGDKWGFVDQNGGWHDVPQPCSDLKNFQEELAAVCLTGSNTWGFIGQDMQWVIPPTVYTNAGAGFSNGFCPAQKNGVWGFIGRDGGWNDIPQPCDLLGSFQDGLAGVRRPDGVWGFIDKSMKWRIPPTTFTMADEGLREFFIKAQNNGEWGFIDDHGGWHPVPQPCAILTSFGSGLAGVCLPVSGVWGFVYNEDPGKWAIPPTNFTYADAGFREEMCQVKQNGNWCFIDIHGKVVFVPNL
jgi:hypothetical protein